LRNLQRFAGEIPQTSDSAEMIWIALRFAGYWGYPGGWCLGFILCGMRAYAH